MLAFPNFYGRKHENASHFLNDLEMALLASVRDEDEVKLIAFPLVLKDKAKTWFEGLPMAKRRDWDTFKDTFLAKYINESSPERLWEKLLQLQYDTLGLYSA